MQMTSLGNKDKGLTNSSGEFDCKNLIGAEIGGLLMGNLELIIFYSNDKVF